MWEVAVVGGGCIFIFMHGIPFFRNPNSVPRCGPFKTGYNMFSEPLVRRKVKEKEKCRENG